VPVHLHPSGAANKDVRKHVDQIIEKVARADRKRSLNFVSVDADEGYNDYSETTFQILEDFFKGAEFGLLFRDFVLCQGLFSIGG
jgi:hypothetical protein